MTNSSKRGRIKKKNGQLPKLLPPSPIMKLKVAHSNYLPTILSALERGTADNIYIRKTTHLLSQIK